MDNLDNFINECKERSPEELEKMIMKIPVIKKEFYIKQTILDNQTSILIMLNDKGYSLKEVANFINKFFDLKVNKAQNIYPISDKNIIEILGDKILKPHKNNSLTRRGRPTKISKSDINSNEKNTTTE
jgi:hypothetical protein